MTDAQQQYEYLKACAARYVLPQRKRLTPSSAREREKEFPAWSRVVTWQQWWERKFNDKYSEFIKRMQVSE